MWHYLTPSSPSPPFSCSLLAKMKEVHYHHSAVAKEKKDRIALAMTSSDPYLLCTHISSSGGEDSDSMVEKDNLKGQLKCMNCVQNFRRLSQVYNFL